MQNIPRLLRARFGARLFSPQAVDDIPQQGYLVYILLWKNQPVILGHGRRNRARVLFDGPDRRTVHIKSIVARAYLLYGGGEATLTRYLITCDGKAEAAATEKALHLEIGGNRRDLPRQITDALFEGIRRGSLEWIFLRQALTSSFDGIDDLYRWNSDGLIPKDVWDSLTSRLGLPQKAASRRSR